MNTEEFHILSLKVINGEASQEETSELEALCRDDSELKKEFNEILATQKMLRETVPLGSSLEANAPKISESQMSRLLGLVRGEAPNSTETYAVAPSLKEAEIFYSIRTQKIYDPTKTTSAKSPFKAWRIILGLGSIGAIAACVLLVFIVSPVRTDLPIQVQFGTWNSDTLRGGLSIDPPNDVVVFRYDNLAQLDKWKADKSEEYDLIKVWVDEDTDQLAVLGRDDENDSRVEYIELEQDPLKRRQQILNVLRALRNQ